MTYNVATYCIYLVVTVFIIVYVGRLLHRNGRVFILAVFGEERSTDHLNNILLIAYYLFNIGYAFIRLRFWQTVTSTELLVSSLSENISVLIFILACTHYINMLVIATYFRSKNISLPNNRFNHEQH